MWNNTIILIEELKFTLDIFYYKNCLSRKFWNLFFDSTLRGTTGKFLNQKNPLNRPVRTGSNSDIGFHICRSITYVICIHFWGRTVLYILINQYHKSSCKFRWNETPDRNKRKENIKAERRKKKCIDLETNC